MRPRRVTVRRGPSLLGTMAIGGAGYAIGSSRAKGAAQDQAQSQQIADLQAQQEAMKRQGQYAPPPPSQPASPPGAPGMSMDDKIAQLQKLGELKAAGVLTEQEFQAQKASILAA